jgi:hypothetical protein
MGFTALPMAAADHPIGGVISLLEKLQVESRKEGEAEQVSFNKFKSWCKRSTRMLTRAMKKEKKAIEELTIKVDGLNGQVAGLAEDIAEYDKQLAELQAQADKADAMRRDENELYQDDVANLDSSIEADHQAIEVMSEAEEGFLLQRHSGHHLRRHSGHHVVSKDHVAKGVKVKGVHVAKGSKGKDGPDVVATEDHAGGVIETFKSFEDEWSMDKLSEEEQETNAQNAYNLAKQARDSSIKSAESSRSEKDTIKAAAEEGAAQAQSDLDETTRMLESDSATLAATDAQCKTKSSEFEERSKIRAGELEAMTMAIKILTKVSNVRNPDEHVVPTKALIQATAVVEQDTSNFGYKYGAGDYSFLQVDPPMRKAMALLRKAASSAHSKALAKLATQIETYDGPFDKIKQMIEKMVFRLMAEQKDEDDHKLWCDDELAKATESKEEKTEKVDLLKLKTSEMDSSIKVLARKVSENDEKTAEINDYIKEETELRDENHAEIMATIKDAQDAQNAITEAIKVLTEFYKKSGMIPKEPWEFIQTQQKDVVLPDAPSTWDASYTGVSDPKSGGEGILTILDEAMQKFSAQEADAKVADEVDQKNYDEDMAAKGVDLQELKLDTAQKKEKKDGLEEKLASTANNLKNSNSALKAVEKYMQDLEPACGSGDSSFEDRKKARADEVEALKKAQTILEEAFQEGLLQTSDTAGKKKESQEEDQAQEADDQTEETDDQ